MLFVGPPDNVLYIEFLSQPRIELADADLDLGAKPFKSLNALQQLAPELLLRGFGQVRDLCDRQFKCFDHAINIARRPLPRTFKSRAVWRGGSARPRPDRPARGAWDNGPSSRPSRPRSCRARSLGDRASPARADAPAREARRPAGA